MVCFGLGLFKEAVCGGASVFELRVGGMTV